MQREEIGVRLRYCQAIYLQSSAMVDIQALAKLASTTRERRTGLSELLVACDQIARMLRAKRAYVLYATDQEGTARFGAPPEEDDVWEHREAYWVVNRFLIDEGRPVAFDVDGEAVSRLAAARQGLRRTHMASLLPMHEGVSEMLVVEGLNSGISLSDIAIMEVVSPIMAHLVARLVDVDHEHRRKTQLKALADLSRVLTRSSDKEEMLTDLATAVATVTRFDAVAIAAFDEAGSGFAYRALNDYRFSGHNVSEGYKEGLFDRILMVMGQRSSPTIFVDLPNAEDPDLLPPEKQVLVEMALFASLALFPLTFRGDRIGVMSFCSFSPHTFGDDEMELLTSIGGQASMIIKGLDLYDELRASNEKLEEYAELLRESASVDNRLARTDSLTGLPNRRYLEEALERECAKRDTGSGLQVMMVDIDDFKVYNDRFGHKFGDDVLKLVTGVSRNLCGDGEIAGRYGGDELLFLLPGKSQDEAAAFADTIRRTIGREKVVTPDGAAIPLSISVGIAGSRPGCPCTPAQIVERADKAMYESKSLGGNRVSIDGVSTEAATPVAEVRP